MHKILELTGCPIGAGARRFFHPGKQMMMVKIQPGEVYVTSERELISTGLGSCISACVWDPFIELGGMNHFMLPFGDADNIEGWDPTQWRSNAARYGNYAMELLINTMIQQGAVKSRLRVKLFGGGMVMGKQAAIGKKNIEFIRSYVESEGLVLVSEDLGTEFPRKVVFDPMTGKAWVKKLRGYRGEVEAEESNYKRRLVKEAKREDDDSAELF
ncbi:chemotaxis protein CheD [Enterovibrio nigricans]|uniref:Probable chemoreceptor glutamine deamidase CheD n=1 Tax=Enterovibrio nigricans DSM 22720 TaxID=1121868 RepID=A0A1T4TYL0_9GAMM|nr:chemotaxis protein CheD [Enterovibrio nigricans]SKA45510.1 chemotaxis protein CheD [Enterovibrio nigricans DSM 22720]